VRLLPRNPCPPTTAWAGHGTHTCRRDTPPSGMPCRSTRRTPPRLTRCQPRRGSALRDLRQGPGQKSPASSVESVHTIVYRKKSPDQRERKTFACLLFHVRHQDTQYTGKADLLGCGKCPQLGRAEDARSPLRSVSQPRRQSWQQCRQRVDCGSHAKQGVRFRRRRCRLSRLRRRRRRRGLRRQVKVPRRQQHRQPEPHHPVHPHHPGRHRPRHLRQRKSHKHLPPRFNSSSESCEVGCLRTCCAKYIWPCTLSPAGTQTGAAQDAMPRENASHGRQTAAPRPFGLPFGGS